MLLFTSVVRAVTVSAFKPVSESAAAAVFETEKSELNARSVARAIAARYRDCPIVSGSARNRSRSIASTYNIPPAIAPTIAAVNTKTTPLNMEKIFTSVLYHAAKTYADSSPRQH